MGLRRIINIYKVFAEGAVKLFPHKKDNIDTIFFGLSETTDDMLYENRKENINRYPWTEINMEVESVLIILQKINQLMIQKPVDYKSLLDNLWKLDPKFMIFQDRFKNSRKSLRSLINHIDGLNEKETKVK